MKLKLHERMNKSRFAVIVTSCGRNKNLDEIKKDSRTSPDVQFKKNHRLNKKLDLEWTMSELGKPFRKKSDPKNRNSKNQSDTAACEQKNH